MSASLFYSFGVVLLEILLEKKPGEGISVTDRCRELEMLLEETNIPVTEQLMNLIRRCVSGNRSDRPNFDVSANSETQRRVYTTY